jgi:hypothetical protein
VVTADEYRAHKARQGGKSTMLKVAWKQAKERYRGDPTVSNKALRDYMERARAASVILQDLRKR